MDIDVEIRKVQDILKGNFANLEDKMYWQSRLNELQIKKSTIKNNEEYFKSMRKYDRL